MNVNIDAFCIQSLSIDVILVEVMMLVKHIGMIYCDKNANQQHVKTGWLLAGLTLVQQATLPYHLPNIM